MPIPSSVEDLDPAAANNSPGGSEPIGPNLDGYLRAYAAIIRQVSDASKVEAQIHGATSKGTPADADELPITDSEASFGRKKLTFANLKTWVKSAVQGGLAMSGLLKFAAGSNIASAATVDLTSATGNTVHITGATGISAWTMTAGQFMNVIFDGILTLTHHATNNSLPTAVNITTATGDRAMLYYDGVTVYVFAYQRADGTSLAASGNQKMLLTAAVDATSGTVINFSSLPSWANEITINLRAVSTNGTSRALIRVGSGSYLTSGYSSTAGAIGSTADRTGPSGVITSGFTLDGYAPFASWARTGLVTLSRISGNIWVVSGALGDPTNGVSNVMLAGSIDVAGTLDRLQVTTVSGDTFDGGSISLSIKGYIA